MAVAMMSMGRSFPVRLLVSSSLFRPFSRDLSTNRHLGRGISTSKLGEESQSKNVVNVDDLTPPKASLSELAVVVHNISKDTTEEAIKEHFSQFGKVKRVITAQKSSKVDNLRSSYVMFSSQRDAEKATQKNIQSISTQDIDLQVDRFTRNESFIGKSKYVALTSLSNHLTIEELRDYFQQYGDVKQVELKVGYYEGSSAHNGSNLAFVHFYKVNVVDEILKTENHVISGRRVKVLRSNWNMKSTYRWCVLIKGLPVSTQRSDVKDFFLDTFSLVPNHIFIKSSPETEDKVVCIVSFAKESDVDVISRKPTLSFQGIQVSLQKLFWSNKEVM